MYNPRALGKAIAAPALSPNKILWKPSTRKNDNVASVMPIIKTAQKAARIIYADTQSKMSASSRRLPALKAL